MMDGTGNQIASLLPLAFLFLTTSLLSLTFLSRVSEHALQCVIGQSGGGGSSCGLVLVF
jgi:hypothetical protein